MARWRGAAAQPRGRATWRARPTATGPTPATSSATAGELWLAGGRPQLASDWWPCCSKPLCNAARGAGVGSPLVLASCILIITLALSSWPGLALGIQVGVIFLQKHCSKIPLIKSQITPSNFFTLLTHGRISTLASGLSAEEKTAEKDDINDCTTGSKSRLLSYWKCFSTNIVIINCYFSCIEL